jgi:DNA-binding LytR/AlgR family response regulator
MKPPLVIITTAYSEYALDGFRLHVVDYLLKPYSFGRFVQATDKALELFRLRLSADNDIAEKDMYIRQGDSFVRINHEDIVLVEAMQNYLKIHMAEKTYTIHQTMVSMEESLPKDRFYRVHNSFIVNVGCIEQISGGKLMVGGKEIPLSKHRKEDFLHSVVYKNLISK